MNPEIQAEQIHLQHEKRTNGLLYGLIAGLVFSLLAWGLDSLLLWQANAAYPWIKLVIGASYCLLLTAIAGLVTSYFDNGFIASLIWLVAGLLVAWFFSQLPFNGLSTFIGLFRPELRGLDLYPFGQSAAGRRALLYIGLGGMFGLTGFLQLLLMEGAMQASTLSRRIFLLALCTPVLVIAGLMADSAINAPLRSPILALDELIRLRRSPKAASLSKEKARDLHLRSLDPFEEWIDRPYRMVLGEYDVDSLTEVIVAINFSGDWGRCWVIEGQPTFCQQAADLFLNRLNCLITEGVNSACRMQVGAGVHSQLAHLQQTGISGSAVLEQQGNIVLVAAAAGDGTQYRCRVRSVGEAILEACDQVPPGTFSPDTLAAGVRTPTPPASAGATITTSTPLPDQKDVDSASTPAVPEPPAALSAAPHYTVTLQVDFENRSYNGTSQVDYTNAETADLDRLYFRLLPNAESSYGGGSLTVRQTELNGEVVEPALSLHDTVLEIPLPAPLSPGERARVGFHFEGKVPEDFGGQANPTGYGIYNFSDGVLAMSGFYPMLAVFDEEGWNLDRVTAIGDTVYSDMAFYTVEVEAQSDLIVVATGSLLEVSSQKPGIQHLRFKELPARDFFIVFSRDFQVVKETIDGITVNSYYLLEHPRAGKRALNVAVESLEVFNKKLGAYPYEEFDVVEAPMLNALGVEFPGIVLVSSSLYDDPENTNFDVTVTHEVAHQWWYSLVGNDVYDEPWLDEGLTTYTSSLYSEFTQGSSDARGLIAYWQERYDRLLQAGADEPVTRPLSFFEQGENARAYSGVVYIKAALFFHALRQEVGDEAFFAALQKYVSTYQYQIARGEDLLGIFEETSGRELDELYQKWLFKE